MTESGGQLIRRKIKAADGRKPDAAVFEYAENLNAKLIEGLVLEPKFTLTPRFHDAEISSLKSVLAGVPAKSLFCNSADVLLHLDNRLAYHWIELGLSGQISDEEKADAYTPSYVDQILSRPFFECLLTSIQEEFPEKIRIAEKDFERALNIERLVDNVKYLDETSKVVVLTYMFTDPNETLDLAMRLVLPLNIVEELTVGSNPISLEDAPSKGLWYKHMKVETMSLPLELTAVVEQLRLPIDEISRFEEGQTLRIPRENLEKLRIVVEDQKTIHEVAKGKLGLHRQMKAVKLTEPPETKLRTILSLANR